MDSSNFSNQQQERIYRRLNSLVGPGAAAFWRDACRLMEMEPLLESTTHYVAHSLREIESALRDVLEILTNPTLSQSNLVKCSKCHSHYEPKCPECGHSIECPKCAHPLEVKALTHKDEIHGILQALGIAETDSIAQTWLRLADRKNEYALHERAHRMDLAPPRRVDDEFRRFWEEIQDVFDVILDRFEAHYSGVFRILDELLTKSHPTKADRKKLRLNVGNSLVTLSYFFRQLQSQEWLNPLWKEGFFKNPPSPGLPWPQSQYLARMASVPSAGETILNIALEILETGTKNALVHQDLAQAALIMPPELAARWVKKETEWLKEQNNLEFSFTEKLGQLVTYLANENQVDTVLALLQELLAVLPNPQSTNSQISFLLREPRVRFTDYEYGELLENYVPKLLEVAGESTFKMLCDLLNDAVRLSPYPDYCEDSRNAIEDDLLGTRGLLISALRDAGEYLTRKNPEMVRTLVLTLESYDWTIFYRIALHLLLHFPKEVHDLIAERLIDRDRFQSQQWFYEYKLLVSEQFSLLPSEAQETILVWIEEGLPDISWLSESEADRASYLKKWKRDWLSILGTPLPESWQQQYEQLVKELGAAEPLQPTGGIRQLLFVPNNLEFPAELEATQDCDEISIVREVLERDLEPEQELSPRIWYACGKKLSELINLDWDWTVEKLEKIFPKDEACQKLRHAAWEGYVTSAPPYLDLFAILREEYTQAIERFGRLTHQGLHLLNSDEVLTKHLMQLYWHGQLELGESDQLLERFFEKAPEQNRVAFMRELGWFLSRDQSEVSPELLERLQRLWDWRIGTILGLPAITIYVSELKTFGSWFACGRFNSQWAIAQLIEVLSLAKNVDDKRKVSHRLVDLAPSMPLEAVKCWDLMAEERQGKDWIFIDDQENSRAIVSAALQLGEEETRKAAKELINRLLARNYADLRDLLSGGEV